MPGFKVDTKLTMKGPLFRNPTAKVAAFLEDAELTLAEAGVNMVLARLGMVLRNPTGYYESQIQTERVSDHWEVNDTRKVLYGPWLEGTGSRNSTTRFKGYRTFRTVKQELDQRTPEIIRPAVRRFINQMGGSSD